MFSFEVMRHGELRNNRGTITIPEPVGGENFPIDEPNLTNTVSTIMVLTTIARGATQGISIGHSDIGLLCNGVISQGEEGIRELAGLAKTLLSGGGGDSQSGRKGAGVL